MAKKKITLTKDLSFTEELNSKWARSNNHYTYFDKDSGVITTGEKDIVCTFLDFKNSEANSFLDKMIKEFILSDKKELDPELLSKEEKVRVIVLFLIQISRYLAPKDNLEFLLKVLIHLAKNPLFANFSSAAHIKLKTINEGFLNQPALGVYVCPNEKNKYTFAINKSPTELYLFYVGQDGLSSYKDSDLIQYSYGTINSSVFIHESNASISASELIAIQRTNSGKIGNLAKQMEDPQPILAIVKSVVTNLPGIKNNFFVLKAVDVALKFWNK